MSLGARRAAPAAIIVACALAAPAARAADRDVLVGDLAQVTGDVAQAPATDLPPVTKEPPVHLATPTPTPTPSSTTTATPPARLARTGSDAAVAALAGLGLVGVGLGLRRVMPDGAPD